MIDENLSLFQEITNSQRSSDEFFQEICFPKGEDLFIANNTVLMGILFGYGRNNAVAFANRHCFRKLETFQFQESGQLSRIFDIGFMTLSDKSNGSENQQVSHMFYAAKTSIQDNFSHSKAFDVFIELFTNKDDYVTPNEYVILDKIPLLQSVPR